MTTTRATVDTTPYRRSHLKNPRGRGAWLFRDLSTGRIVGHTGTYTEAKKSLPAGGSYQLLP